MMLPFQYLHAYEVAMAPVLMFMFCSITMNAGPCGLFPDIELPSEMSCLL